MKYFKYKMNTGILIIFIHAIFLSCIINTNQSRLTIIVPKSYEGEVVLVASNIEKDILKVDSNGIGYITVETFEKTEKEPIVIEPDGININKRIVGYNSSTFFATGQYNYHSIGGKEDLLIQFLSFEVVPKGKEGQKQYYATDLEAVLDKTKLKP